MLTEILMEIFEHVWRIFSSFSLSLFAPIHASLRQQLPQLHGILLDLLSLLQVADNGVSLPAAESSVSRQLHQRHGLDEQHRLVQMGRRERVSPITLVCLTLKKRSHEIFSKT